MSGPTRAFGAGLAVVGVGATAHVMAGGSLPLGPTAASLLAATALGGAVRRWTFWRLVLVTAAAQPVLHLVFGAGGSERHGHAHSHAHGMAPGIMPWAHVVATLATAVLLRWGLRWLRVLPGVARALLVPSPRLTANVLAQWGWTPAARPLALVTAPARLPTSRGPPR